MEKISDNIIKCILSGVDLASRNLSVSELAYGSDKAKQLFGEMLNEANLRFGFQKDQGPLLIEAIPMDDKGLTIYIANPGDIDELDMKFAKFAPSILKESTLSSEGKFINPIEDVMKMFNQILGSVAEKSISPISSSEDIKLYTAQEPEKKGSAKSEDIVAAFLFKDIKSVKNAARIIKPAFNGKSALYKNTLTGDYFLVVHNNDNMDLFMKTCNVLIEYGLQVKKQFVNEQYYKEHYEIVIPDDAIFEIK